MTAVTADAGKFWECLELRAAYDERFDAIRTTPVDDLSLSETQLLHQQGKKRLLNRGIPFQEPDDIKRETSKTHRRRLDADSTAYERKRSTGSKYAAPVKYYTEAEIAAVEATRKAESK